LNEITSTWIVTQNSYTVLDVSMVIKAHFVRDRLQGLGIQCLCGMGEWGDYKRTTRHDWERRSGDLRRKCTSNELMSTPGCKRFRHIYKDPKKVERMVKQAKLGHIDVNHFGSLVFWYLVPTTRRWR
jgi:hypothetical protein